MCRVCVCMSLFLRLREYIKNTFAHTHIYIIKFPRSKWPRLMIQIVCVFIGSIVCLSISLPLKQNKKQANKQQQQQQFPKHCTDAWYGWVDMCVCVCVRARAPVCCVPCLYCRLTAAVIQRTTNGSINATVMCTVTIAIFILFIHSYIQRILPISLLLSLALFFTPFVPFFIPIFFSSCRILYSVRNP